MDYEAETEETRIQRDRLFVLYDGTFVVRWTDNRVQELETGNYRLYKQEDFGAPITDYELNQLKAVGLIEQYDGESVWLCPLPERNDYNWVTSWERNRSRSYYLNTTLPGSLLSDVIDLLEDLELTERFQPRTRDDFVVLWSSKGISFQKFDEVEKARHLLISKAPEAFGNTVVAFIETTRRS